MDWKLRRLPGFSGFAGFHYRGTHISTRVFCIGVWISSLVAIWISRGWVGLFLSGQVLSAGTLLWKGTPSRPQSEPCRGIEPNEPAFQPNSRLDATETFLSVRSGRFEISQ
jgi:hypothetical protein